MPELTLDGKKLEVPSGTTIIQAADDAGIFIPRYCYHPGLSIAGNCRICLVDVEMFPKLQIACNTPVNDGMVVHTNSQKAEEGRRTVLEFLLANHPLDCPVCDQSGECDLQNFYMNFGLYDPKFREHKVKKQKAVALGPNVMLDQERCILCSRCVRFTDEVTGTGEFGIFNRGDRAQLGIYPGTELDNAYSANVVDICPVGALTERKFRFKARVWYLSSAPTVCNGCSRGCSIDMHFTLDRPHLNDGKRLLRVKPRYNPDVNEWWLCDEGRYGFDWLDEDRLVCVRGPEGRLGRDAPEPDWDEALDAVAAGLEGGSVGVLATTQLTNEELFLLKRIQDRLEARVSVFCVEDSGSHDEILVRADKSPNSRGAELLGFDVSRAGAEQVLEEAAAGRLDVLWAFGVDLALELGVDPAKELSERLKLLVLSGTNAGGADIYAHYVLPTAAYVERDGTFVNADGVLQRIGRAFPPLGNSREDWRLLLGLADRLGVGIGAEDPAGIFHELAASSPPFAGITYEAIGDHGRRLETSETTGAATP